jgi:hypothetical protein
MMAMIIEFTRTIEACKKKEEVEFVVQIIQD